MFDHRSLSRLVLGVLSVQCDTTFGAHARCSRSAFACGPDRRVTSVERSAKFHEVGVDRIERIEDEIDVAEWLRARARTLDVSHVSSGQFGMFRVRPIARSR